jgi:osmotically-inducible protein OsmY
MSIAVSCENPTVGDLQADFDLCQRVKLYLAHTGHAPVRSFQVQADAGVITIKGIAPTYYVRQLALACTRRVAGVQRVVDEIVVLPAETASNRWPTLDA